MCQKKKRENVMVLHIKLQAIGEWIPEWNGSHL